MSTSTQRPSSSLIECLLESSRRLPERVALVHKDRRVTYSELWSDIVTLSQRLSEHGLKVGDRVGLLIENSPEYVTTYYATLLAGGIAVGLNTASRAHELVRNLKHCGARILVTQAAHPELGRVLTDSELALVVTIGEARTPLQFAGQSLPYAELLGAAVGDGSEELAVRFDSNSPACIIYTSGTTGDAKGVTLSHGNLFANTQSIVQYLDLTSADSIVNVLPFFYSYGNSVLHSHLAVGGTIYLENSMSYPHLVVEKLAQVGATGFAGVPSTFALLLQRVDFKQYDLHRLRYVTQAGGAMKNALIEKLRSVVPNVSVFVMYGQTEATARLTYLPPSQLSAKLGSVGRPVPGVNIQVRNEEGAQLSSGELGEVWAQGPNVMLGYWNDETGTSMVLRDGWLKTGDLGHLDTDGYLYLQGRRSDMIKSGAHRIHPKEIEDVIAEMPGVKEVAVVGVEDEILGQAIRAVIVPESTGALTAMQVQAFCKQRLAVHKIPKNVVMVSDLPKTASGKVRRVELERGELN